MSKRMRLSQEALAGLSSLVKQTALVSMGLIIMLLLTSGSPPGLCIALFVCLGIGFVAYSEQKRLQVLRKKIDD
jgi:hypothetical protein